MHDPREQTSDNARFGVTRRGYRADRKHERALAATQLKDKTGKKGKRLDPRILVPISFGVHHGTVWTQLPLEYLYFLAEHHVRHEVRECATLAIDAR